MKSFTLNMNWLRAKCTFLVGEDGVLFCFLLFLCGLDSSKLCATFSCHGDVDGRAPVSWEGSSKYSRCPGPQATFSIFKLCKEAQRLIFWRTTMRRPVQGHRWSSKLGTASGGCFLPFLWNHLSRRLLWIYSWYQANIRAERLGVKCGGGNGLYKTKSDCLIFFLNPNLESKFALMSEVDWIPSASCSLSWCKAGSLCGHLSCDHWTEQGGSWCLCKRAYK